MELMALPFAASEDSAYYCGNLNVSVPCLPKATPPRVPLELVDKCGRNAANKMPVFIGAGNNAVTTKEGSLGAELTPSEVGGLRLVAVVDNGKLVLDCP